MTVEEQVTRMVERIRAVWGVGTSLALVYVVVALPWWALPIFCVFSIGTYFAALYLAGMYLAATLKPEDFATPEVTIEESEEGLSKDGIESIGMQLGEVIATGEIFGRYLDQPMFEWVDVRLGAHEQVARYTFEHVTPRDKAGNLLLPREDGLACYYGVTYKRGQPA